MSKSALPSDVDHWRTAVVLALTKDSAEIGFADRSLGSLPLQEMRWARRFNKQNGLARARNSRLMSWKLETLSSSKR